MDAFFQWLLADRTYVDLLAFGVIMTLCIVANLLEERGVDPADYEADLTEPTDYL